MKTSKLKRTLCSLMCLSLLLLCLVGCKKDQPKVDPNVNPTIGMGDTALEGTDPAPATTPDTPSIPAEPDVTNTPAGTGDDSGTGAGASSGESESGPAVEAPDVVAPADPADVTGASTGEPPILPDTPTTDPWALSPAPSVETLIRNAFPKDKTVHATLAMNMFGELMMDLSSFAEDMGAEDTSGLENLDTGISLYMSAQVSQDKDAMYMDGTMTSQAMGESSVDESKGYCEKLTDGTQNNYTYNAETGGWTVENSPIQNGAFGLEAIIGLASDATADYSDYEMETTKTEYIVTGRLKGGAADSIMKSFNANTDGGTNPTGDDTSGIVMRFDKETQNIKSVIVTMPPINALFFTFTTMTMAIANITFDTADVSVPSNVKAVATPASTLDMSNFS